MSKEKIKLFFKELEKNPELQAKFLEKMKDEKTESAADVTTKAIAFGKTAGFDFTEDELKEYSAELMDAMHENNELPDEEIKDAAGGFSKQAAILSSICTLGVGCALISIISATRHGKSACAQQMSIGTDGCHD